WTNPSIKPSAHSNWVTARPELFSRSWRALRLRGEQERAIQVLQAYLRENASDAAAVNQLADLQAPFESATERESSTASNSPPVPMLATSTLLPSNWLPADIDEKVPPVDSGVAC